MSFHHGNGIWRVSSNCIDAGQLAEEYGVVFLVHNWTGIFFEVVDQNAAEGVCSCVFDFVEKVLAALLEVTSGG